MKIPQKILASFLLALYPKDMDKHTYAQRRERLRACLRQRGLDALWIVNAANRFYLSGFELHDGQCNESSGSLLITAGGRDWLCTDPRFFDAARRIWDEDRIFIYRGDAFALTGDFIRNNIKGLIGFEARALCCHGLRATGLSLLAADGMVEKLRSSKDAQEVEALRVSCALNHELMLHLPALLTPKRTEAGLAWEIERFFRERGATELAFPSIVGKDSNAALPHYEASDSVALDEECLVLVDCGARLARYCSDQTRSFWTGVCPTSDFLRTLELVQGAQKAAIDGLRPGMSGAQAYGLAYDFFERHGVEKAFTHSLGHGIGLETHEGISLGPRCEQRLAPGMVVTVEPGLYYPEWGGVRWEYMVLVEEDGPHIL